MALACSSAAWNSRGSISNSTCPAATSSPSWNVTWVSTPVTCAWTDTVCTGSAVPVAGISNGTARCSAWATVTGTRATARAFARTADQGGHDEGRDRHQGELHLFGRSRRVGPDVERGPAVEAEDAGVVRQLGQREVP